MKQKTGFLYGQLEQLKELAQQNNVSPESQHNAKLLVRRSLPITDAEHKKLMKALYPVDKSKKFRRQ